MWMDLELFAQVRLEAELAKFLIFALLGSCDTSVPSNTERWVVTDPFLSLFQVLW